jgi:hypothetical protein
MYKEGFASLHNPLVALRTLCMNGKNGADPKNKDK